MADLGGPEIIVIIVAVALLFGWRRMPDMARSLGRSVRIFKSELDQLKAGDVPEAGPAPTATTAPVPIDSRPATTRTPEG